MFIKEVSPSIIHNSRGERSIHIRLKTYEGVFTASAPSGKSRGKNEVEPYNLQGIEKSHRLLLSLCEKFIGKNISIKKINDLKQIVEVIKKFEVKNGNLGGNVTYVLETAFLKAAASEKKQELFEFIFNEVGEGMRPKMPMPVGNCIGGGLHSEKINGKRPDFQEFLLIPNEKTFARAVTVNIRAYEYARKLLRARGKNDEGAWKTDKTNEEVLDILEHISEKYGVRMGVDVASSTFYEKGYYNYKNKDLIRDKIDQADYMEKLIKKYGLFYVEDPMQEEDFGGFKEVLGFAKEYHSKTMIVGDDLTTTNLKQVRRAVISGSINAMIVKPNQIGSILEVKQVVDFCKKHNIKIIFSHRSGETMDDALADYAVGFGADFIKTGISGPERLIKLKRVMDIEKALSL
jgi:enolase